ncbi:hypothetical protein D3C80_462510 [compost metagenome]
MGDPSGENARLSCSCTRQNENRAIDGLDSLTLLGIKAREVIRRWACTIARGKGARSNAQSTRCPALELLAI